MTNRKEKVSTFSPVFFFLFLILFNLTYENNSLADVDVDITGGGITKSQTIQGDGGNFTFSVPLKPNTLNIFRVGARDDAGNVATSEAIEITQVSLDKVVVAKATSERLSTSEVHDLVRRGVIDLSNPENYHVTKFDVVFTVNNRPYKVIRYVARKQTEVVVSEHVELPKDSGRGGGNDQQQPVVKMIDFELPDLGGISPPPIPGLLIIDGKIKTLKEFFKVKLLLLNTSQIFDLQDVKAKIFVPAGLTNISPKSGENFFGDIGHGNELSKKWIVRGDRIGHYDIRLQFAGNLIGPGFDKPVPITGSASTQIEVKGPPHLAVVLEHPDYIERNKPYQLLVNITNTSDIPANFASLALALGKNLRFNDENGPKIDSRDLGDILPGQTVTQAFTVYPEVSGEITSCVGGASSNLQLFVKVGEKSCAVGTYEAQSKAPSERAAIRIVPVNGEQDVAVDTEPTIFFSKPVNHATLSTGSAGTTVILSTLDGQIVPTFLRFTTLPSGEEAVSLGHQGPLAYNTTYVLTVSPDIYDINGTRIASGMSVRFKTSPSPLSADTTPPDISIVIPGNIDVNSVVPGSLFKITAMAQDSSGIARVEYLLDGKVQSVLDSYPYIFAIDTNGLEPGSSHELKFRAIDKAGNGAETVQDIVLAQEDTVPPQVSVNLDKDSVLQGQKLSAVAAVTDNGGIDHVEFRLDGSGRSICLLNISPYACNVDTSSISAGTHQLLVIARDSSGNEGQANASFTVIRDTSPPVLEISEPKGTVQLLKGTGLPVKVTATDNFTVRSINYYLDGSSTPFATGNTAYVSTDDLNQGGHEVRVVATDVSGNTATKGVQFTVLLPPQPGPNPPEAVNASKVKILPAAPDVFNIIGEQGASPYLHKIEARLSSGVTFISSSDVSGSFLIKVACNPGSEVTLYVIDADGKRSSPVTLTIPSITLVHVDPSEINFNRIGEQVVPSYSLVFSNGEDLGIDPQTVDVVVEDTSIAKIASNGAVTAISNGSTELSVSYPGLNTVVIPIHVNAKRLVDIAVSPGSLVFQDKGEKKRLSVVASYSDGTSSNLYSGVNYSIDQPNIASVSSSGWVTALSNGSATIRVKADSIIKEIPVTVSIRHPVSLSVSPNLINFSNSSDHAQLRVIMNYDNGTTKDITAIANYSSSNTAVCRVTSSGLVIPWQQEGNSIITVSYDGLTSVSVSVTFARARVTAIEVSPSRIDFDEPGATRQLSIMYRMSDGSYRTGQFDELQLSSNDESVATVDPDGIVHAVGIGETNLVIVYTPDPSVPVVTVPVTVADLSSLPSEPPEITGIPRTVLGVGDHLVIFATNLSDNIALDHVFVGNVELKVTSVAKGMIVAEISPGTESGPVSLRVYDKDSVNQVDVTILPRKAKTYKITDKFVVAGVSSTWNLAQTSLEYVEGDDVVISGAWDLTTAPSWTGHLFLQVDDSQPVELSQSGSPVDLTPYLTEGKHVLKFSISSVSGQPIPGNELATVYVPAATMPFDGAGEGDGTTSVEAISLSAGQTVVISAEGTAHDGAHASGPDGYATCSSSCAVDGFQKMELLGRFNSEEPFAIGSGPMVFTAPEDGTLYLGINDNSYGDNTGGYTVHILEAQTGSGVATDGLYLQAGPPGTGIFAGIRELLADGADRRFPVTFTGLNLPDGTKVGVTAVNHGTNYNGHPVGSAGGSIIGGESSNYSGFKVFTIQNGKVTVTYSDSGIVYGPGITNTARIQLVPANDQNHITSFNAISVAEVQLAGISTGSFILSQASVIADGSANTVHFTLTDIRDALGNLVPDGTKVGVTAVNHGTNYNGHPVSSAGGSIIGGENSNYSGFKVFTVQNGRVEGEYSTGSIVVSGQETKTARLQAVVAMPNNHIGSFSSFAVTPIILSAPFSDASEVVVSPGSIVADGGNNTVQITFLNLRDALGNLVPDGTKVGVTAVNHGTNYNGHPVSSAGGSIIGGENSNYSGFKVFTVQNGKVTVTYSDSGIVLGPGITKTARIQLVPANDQNHITSFNAISVAEVQLAGISTGSFILSQASVIADGSANTVHFTLTDIRDALGNLVPDGTKVGVTAVNHGTNYNGHPVSSAGGSIIGGENSNYSGFKVFTVQNGKVEGEYSTGSIVVSGQQTKTARLQAVVAMPNNHIGSFSSFAVKEITLVSPLVGANTVTIEPDYIFVDGGNHTAAIRISNIRNAANNPLPDGQRVGISVSHGQIRGGEQCASDSSYRIFTVQNGSVTATYFEDLDIMDILGLAQISSDPILLSMADENNSLIGNQPSIIGEIPLTTTYTAEIEAANSTTAGETISFIVKNIMDTRGNTVPDGTKIAVSAGGLCGRMGYPEGGIITGGTEYHSGDGNFTIFTVQGGSFSGNFTAPQESDLSAILVKPARSDGTTDLFLPCIAIKEIEIRH